MVRVHLSQSHPVLSHSHLSILPWATTATSHILAGYPHASMGNPKRPFPAKALHHAALVPRPEAGRQLCDRTPLQTEISDTRTHKTSGG